MSTLSELITAIDDKVQDAVKYTPEVIARRINEALQAIAGGVRMPTTGIISPPLPDLFKSDTVTTTTAAYVSLPSDYQRKVFKVADSSGYKIDPPLGGDYYSFALFLSQVSNLNLTDAGSVYKVAVKGKSLYYQGIPTVAETLTVMYYRKAATLALDGDEPEGIPDHLQMPLIKHYVLKEIFGEAIEDGQDNVAVGYKYHDGKFYMAMTDLIDYIGIDAEPMFYGGDDFDDQGRCDG